MSLKRFLSFTIALFMSLGCFVTAFAEDDVCASVTIDGSEKEYTSFKEAWSSAVDAGSKGEVTFKLNKNWVAGSDGSFGSGTGFSSGALQYDGKYNLTIDLNGCKIDRNLYTPQGAGAVIYVDAEVTVIDSGSDKYTVSKLFKGGAITGGSNSAAGGGVVIPCGGKLNFNGGTILSCVSTDEGGGIFVGPKAELTIDGGNFYGNRTYDSMSECCGGAICSDTSDITIKNSVFEGNYSEDMGGAIYASDGKIEVENCIFNSNIAREEGGAVYCADDVKSKFSSCTFTCNSSKTDDGGAVFCDSGEGTYFYDCNMYYNDSASEGGAIHINDDKVFVIGGEYRYNTASEQGGGIYVDSMNDINAAGKLVIKNNTVNGKANDLCLQDGVVTTAYLYCGGFYEGSSIYICSSDDDSRLAIKGIDKYQYNNYISFDSGFRQDKIETKSASDDTIRAEASAFSSGNIVAVCVMALIIVIAAVVIIIAVKKKKKRGAETVD